MAEYTVVSALVMMFFFAAFPTRTVPSSRKETQEAFSRVDKASSDLEPFRKRKAAVESLRGSFKSLAETMLEADPKVVPALADRTFP